MSDIIWETPPARIFNGGGKRPDPPQYAAMRKYPDRWLRFGVYNNMANASYHSAKLRKAGFEVTTRKLTGSDAGKYGVWARKVKRVTRTYSPEFRYSSVQTYLLLPEAERSEFLRRQGVNRKTFAGWLKAWLKDADIG